MGMFCDRPEKVITPPDATADWLVPIWVAPTKSLVLFEPTFKTHTLYI